MYRQGFKMTEEERIKQRCNQILNSLEDKTSIESSLNISDNESIGKKLETESMIQRFEDSCINQEKNRMEKED